MVKYPNIAQLYETLETENSYYVVIELCLGGNLLDLTGIKSVREAKTFSRKIPPSVEYPYQHEIAHRYVPVLPPREEKATKAPMVTKPLICQSLTASPQLSAAKGKISVLEKFATGYAIMRK